MSSSGLPSWSGTVEELAGSPRVTGNTLSGFTVERSFKVPGVYAMDFAAALMNSQSPVFPTSVATSVAIEPFPECPPTGGTIDDPETEAAIYAWALVKATYTTEQFDCPWPADVPKPTHEEDTTLTLKTRVSGQFLTLPGRAGAWEDVSPGEDDPPVPPDDKGLVILIPTIDFEVAWEYVDDPPIALYQACVGRVNDDTFLGCAAETLLLEGIEIDPSFRLDIDEPRCYRVTGSFRQRCLLDGETPVTWNHDYREEPAGWARVEVNGEPRYTPVEFDGLFTQSPAAS